MESEPRLDSTLEPETDFSDQTLADQLEATYDRLPQPFEAKLYAWEALHQDNIPEAIHIFKSWRDYPVNLHIRESDPQTGEIRNLFIKTSKRGNDVYQEKLRAKIGRLIEICRDLSGFNYRDRSIDHQTQVLLLTLEYDSNIISQDEAWRTNGANINRTLAHLTKKYGEIREIRVVEAHESGYPHNHIMVIFKEASFTAFHHKSRKGKKLETWRIRERPGIKATWNHGFSDVEAVSNPSGTVQYLAKYLFKSDGLDQTQTLCWLYKIRQFAVSSDLADEIRTLRSNSNQSLAEPGRFASGQVSLGGETVKTKKKYEFMGLVCGRDYHETRFELSQAEVDKLVLSPDYLSLEDLEAIRAWKRGNQ